MMRSSLATATSNFPDNKQRHTDKAPHTHTGTLTHYTHTHALLTSLRIISCVPYFTLFHNDTQRNGTVLLPACHAPCLPACLPLSVYSCRRFQCIHAAPYRVARVFSASRGMRSCRRSRSCLEGIALPAMLRVVGYEGVQAKAMVGRGGGGN